VEDALVDYVARFGDSDGAVTKAAIEPGNDRLRKHLVELMEALLTGRQPRTEFIRRGIKAGVFVNFDCFGDRITRNKLESTGLSGLEILATEQELVRIVEENSGPQALLKRLVDLGGPQAKAALAKRLSTPDKAVEQRAALHAEIVCLVEDLLASRHDDLRAPALEALRRYLKFADVLSWEGFDGDFRVEAGRMVGFYCRAVHLLGRHGARCDADLLIARLGEAGESVRAAIGKALRNLGEPGLGAAVLGDDGDFGRLCQHRDPRLIRPFAHRISGPYSRDDYTVEKWLRTESEHANAADQQIISQALVKMKEWREHFRGSGEW
jgi:hypothetical protein